MFKRGGVYWTCIRHEGRKIQRSLETSDFRLAKAIETKIKTQIVEGKYFEKEIKERKKLLRNLSMKISNIISKIITSNYHNCKRDRIKVVKYCESCMEAGKPVQ